MLATVYRIAENTYNMQGPQVGCSLPCHAWGPQTDCLVTLVLDRRPALLKFSPCPRDRQQRVERHVVLAVVYEVRLPPSLAPPHGPCAGVGT